MSYGRPDWTSSLVGTVSAVRVFLEDGQGFDEVECSLAIFLADDLLRLKDQPSQHVARFQAQTTESRFEPDLLDNIGLALAKTNETDISKVGEETISLLDKLQLSLRQVAEAPSSVPPETLAWLLKVLDHACDFVFGPPPLARTA